MRPINRRCIRSWMFLCLSGVFIQSLDAQQPRVAFVTSVTGTADLGSWPEAGSAVGAAAGNAICQNLATAATLPNASSFVAWLSTSTDDAYCRLHGFTGKKSANCGQATLPVNGGPWVQVDGLPFAESIDRLLTTEFLVYYPLAADENGNSVQGISFTGTSGRGTLYPDGNTCTDWTSTAASAFPQIGRTARGSWGWTSAGGAGCDSAQHLYCFEPGSGPALTPPNEDGAIVFLTSVDGTADLGSWADADSKTGLAAADAICQARAAAGSLNDPSSFKAWISDSTTDAKDRFLDDGPRVRLDGVRVAESRSELLDALLDSSINLTELGTYIGNSGVWTATTTAGVSSGDSCSDWTSASSASSTQTGSAWATDVDWTASFTTDCSFAFATLYCFEDTVILADGFESGDTTGWSSSSP